MANIFLDLPVPIANGVGAPVDVSGMGETKTVTYQGDLFAAVEVQVSGDGVNFEPLYTFSATSQAVGTQKLKRTFTVAARFMRARVSNFRAGTTANMDVGANDNGTSFVTPAVPAGAGAGAGIDVSALGTFNTVYVTGTFTGNVMVQVSDDDIDYSPCMSFARVGGQKSKEFAAAFVRVVRDSVQPGAPGLPVVTVVAVNDATASSGAPLSNTAPVNVTKAAAAAGAAAEASRQDHKHDITTAAPAVGIGGANAEGAATTVARSDHNHTLRETGGPTNLTIGAIADGQALQRSGAVIVGAAAPAAAVWTDDGTNITPVNAAARRLRMRATGNARGANAVDLQSLGTGADDVASGARSCIPGGQNNRADGLESFAMGLGCNALGPRSVALGNNNQVDSTANNSVALGQDARVQRQGQVSFANSDQSFAGDRMRSFCVFARSTTDATPAELTLDGNAPGGTNRFVLGSSRTYTARILVVARRTSPDEHACYSFRFGMKRDGGGVATTAILGVPIKEVLFESVAAWDCNLVADIVNGSLQILVTGAAASVIRWYAEMTFVELQA